MKLLHFARFISDVATSHFANTCRCKCTEHTRSTLKLQHHHSLCVYILNDLSSRARKHHIADSKVPKCTINYYWPLHFPKVRYYSDQATGWKTGLRFPAGAGNFSSSPLYPDTTARFAWGSTLRHPYRPIAKLSIILYSINWMCFKCPCTRFVHFLKTIRGTFSP
jgi:hypothetical protein